MWKHLEIHLHKAAHRTEAFIDAVGTKVAAIDPMQKRVVVVFLRELRLCVDSVCGFCVCVCHKLKNETKSLSDRRRLCLRSDRTPVGDDKKASKANFYVYVCVCVCGHRSFVWGSHMISLTWRRPLPSAVRHHRIKNAQIYETTTKTSRATCVCVITKQHTRSQFVESLLHEWNAVFKMKIITIKPLS